MYRSRGRMCNGSLRPELSSDIRDHIIVKTNPLYAALLLLALACEPPEGPPPPNPGPSGEDLSRILGVRIEEIPGEVRQYLVHARPGTVDFKKIGEVHQDVGHAVGVTLPDGMEIGFRFAGPSSEELSRLLGFDVEEIREEAHQYLVFARRESVDLAKVGRVSVDAGNNVGITMEDGVQIGLRFFGPSAQELSQALGVKVKLIRGELRQFAVYSRPGEVDFSRIGRVHSEQEGIVGVTLPDGIQIGVRYPSSPEFEWIRDGSE